MKKSFRGTGVALVTPFLANGDVDFPSLKKVVEHVIDGKVEYLVILGTTGESVTLNKKEKKAVFDFIKEVNKGRLPLVAGIGGSNTQELLETINEFDFKGISAVLSVSPYYNKPNQQGIYMHYKAVAEACPVPVILYNVPGRTGSNMTAETTLRLAKEKNIIGMKEASGNFEQCMEIIKHKPHDFLVISGDDAITLPLLSCGMDGVISVIANAYPADFSEMVRLALRSDFEDARLLHYRLIDLMKIIFVDGSPGGIKAILELMKLCENRVRLPLATVGNDTYEKIRKLQQQY